MQICSHFLNILEKRGQIISYAHSGVAPCTQIRSCVHMASETEVMDIFSRKNKRNWALIFNAD